ncbi:MAG TPA: hypothetical protein VM582_00655, partial [Candidatus Thermoplasmatota archaeon]|nr:hypothetical protein [Candidatus Thermoplasmatota archaeon]
MQRTKTLGVAAALLSAAVAAVLLTGGASATAWHTYKGDMFAGHAYGLQVPSGAQSIEFLFEGDEAGGAAIGVYAPSGEKLGYYGLGAQLTAASIANPSAGRYVVYVYDVSDGALRVRVNSADEPAKLDLEAVDLLREDTKIGTFEQGKLDQVITAQLKAPAVFVTLLYQGSARDLDATVSSSKGAVVSIKGESATAFSPGVWTTLKGERSFDASKLDGTTYTVEVHAAQFEGTMVLTTLALDLAASMPAAPDARAPMPAAPSANAPKAKASAASFETAAAHFALEEGVPLAFTVSAPTTLALADPAALDEDGDERYDDHCQPLHGVIAIYAPDDSLLALVELSHDEPMALVELPVKGEYVVYARHVEGDVILGRLAGLSAPPALRALATQTETVTFEAALSVPGGARETFELAHTPLDIALRFEDGIGTLSSVHVKNEKGSVAYANALVVAHGANFFQWSDVKPENFAAGEHTLTTHFGTYEGTVELVSTYYVRASSAPLAEAPVEPVEKEEPHKH